MTECFNGGTCQRKLACPHPTTGVGELYYCPFDDSSAGWGLARQFLEHVDEYNITAMHTAFHSANMLARKYPEKYATWRAKLALKGHRWPL